MIRRSLNRLLSLALLLSLPGTTASAQNLVDGFDYPIHHRGYLDNNPVAIPEQIDRGAGSEANDIFPDGATPNPERWSGNWQAGDAWDWHNLNDIGNYLTADEIADPRNLPGGLHPGEDWNYRTGNADVGKAVYAVAHGEIVRLLPLAANGYLLVIKHYLSDRQDASGVYDDVAYSLYLHVAATCRDSPNGRARNEGGFLDSPFEVAVGDWVHRGQKLAVIAQRDRPHLHFEIRHGLDPNFEDPCQNDCTWPNDNGSGYYGDDGNDDDMSLEEVTDALDDMQLDNIVQDPSDFIDANRPDVEDVIVNGRQEIFGGVLADLTDPEIPVRLQLIGGDFGVTADSLQNFTITGSNSAETFYINNPQNINIVPGSFVDHDGEYYSFRLRVSATAIGNQDITEGERYSLWFEILNSNNQGQVARAFSPEKIFFIQDLNFSDVDESSDWHRYYVRYVASKGIATGYPGDLFSPGRIATRDVALKMAYESLGRLIRHPLPEPEFNDVNECHWFYGYVADATARGYLEGDPCPGGSGTCFYPDRDVNRAEAAKIISEVSENMVSNIEGRPHTFDDVPSEAWFHPYVDWMTNAELRVDDPYLHLLPDGFDNGDRITEGHPNGDFEPASNISRAELAKLVGMSKVYFSTRSYDSNMDTVALGDLHEQTIDPLNLSAPPPVSHSGGLSQTLTEPIEITGASTDGDGDVLFYAWRATGGDLAPNEPTNYSSVDWVPPQVTVSTTFLLHAVAGDRRGKVSRSTFEFLVPGDEESVPPTITVTNPDTPGEPATTGFPIRWTAEDPDSNAIISLFYDVNNTGYDGAPVAGAQTLPEDTAQSPYLWDTSTVNSGTYYIYARIDDGVNPPQYSYSTGTVTVDNTENQDADPYNFKLQEYEPGMNYQGIGYAAGSYVAVGKRAAISLSGTEGRTWRHFGSTDITDDMDFYDAHYANGRWFLVGEDNIGGIMIYSDHVDPNGSTYGFVIPNQWYGESVRAIDYRNNRWVAVGHTNLVMYSNDNGETWHQGTIYGTAYSFDFEGLTYDTSTNRWIAVSESNYPSSQVAWSSDGINWYQNDLFDTRYRLQSVAAGGGQVVAVGYTTVAGARELILTSDDGGQTWTDRSNGSQHLYGVVYRPEGWVAVGYETIATSENGTTWHREPGNLERFFQAVVYAADEKNLVAVAPSQICRARAVGSPLHHMIEISVYGSGRVIGAGYSNCRDYCPNSYREGWDLTLTAEPDPGWLLDGWSGGCSDASGNVCELILEQNESIDVNFDFNDPPTLSITEPDGTLDKTHESYMVSWTDEDPDGNAIILLYSDLDADGANGTLLTAAPILEDDENDQFLWETSGLPEDDYYIYGTINDGYNAPVTSISSGPITVIHNTPPTLTFLQPDGFDDTEDLVYTVRWTDEDPEEDATIDFFYDTDSAGADGVAILAAQDISENDETDQFDWDISSLPEEEFYVYAVLEDGVMDPVIVYSPGPVTVLHVSTNTPPTIAILEPDGIDDSADQSFTITWTDEDPDNDAEIRLYYDDDDSGENGTLLTQTPISENDETDQFAWDTSPLDEDDYFIYAVIDDHVRPPVTAYSSGPVTVAHGNAVPSITVHEPDGDNDSADQGYIITWTDDDPDDDATISFYFDEDGAGTDGVLITDGLGEDGSDDSYLWNTAGMTAGDYYVYAVIDDGHHTPVHDYSPGTVSIDHAGYTFDWVRHAGNVKRDRAYAVAADSAGNSYLTGHIRDDIQFGDYSLTHVDNRDAYIVKYDSSGTVAWAYNLGGEDDDYGLGVAVDGDGNVYVTGYFETEMNFGGTVLTAVGNIDLFIAKYNSSGALLWAQRYGLTGWTEANAVAVDNGGNVLITGEFYGSIQFGGTTLSSSGRGDMFIVKLNTHGQVLWSQKAGGSHSSYTDRGNGVAADANGNVYVTGQFVGTADFSGIVVVATDIYNPDAFVAKYSSNGAIQWVQPAGGEYWEEGTAVATDGASAITVTGFFRSDLQLGGVLLESTGGIDGYVARYSSSGALQWVRQIRGSYDQRAYGIATGPSGEIVVSGLCWLGGQFEATPFYGSGGFVAQYSSQGSLQWVRPAPSSTGSAYGESVAMGAGDIFTAGWFSATAHFDREDYSSVGDSDIYLARIDPSMPANSPPELSILEPDGADDVVADIFSVSWTGTDSEDNARILLYSDDNDNGEDGKLLNPAAFAEDSGPGTYDWDVSTEQTGDYYIYGRIHDGKNPPLTVYSSGPLTVDPAAGNLRSLSVSLVGEGSGGVKIDPPGIDCLENCTEEFDLDDEVTLTAEPDSESGFSGWSGGGCSGTSPCTLIMDADKSVTADFHLLENALTVTKTGSGTVTSDDHGIGCGNDCGQFYPYGSPVRLTPVASPGWVFGGWSGDCAGTGFCDLTMDSAKSVEAGFARPQGAAVLRSPSPFGYVSLASLGVEPFDCPTVACDDTGWLLEGLDFYWWDQHYDSVSWVTNGYVYLDASGTATAFNQEMPDPVVPNAVLAPFWSDLDLDGGDGVGAGTWYLANLTDGLSTWHVFEWEGAQAPGLGGSSYSFQIWIEVGTSNIWFTYGPMSSEPPTEVSVGAEDDAGSEGFLFYYNGAVLPPAWGSELRVLTPGYCAGIADLAISDQVLGDSEVFEACNSITVGPETDIVFPGDVTLTSGGPVEFRDRFAVHSDAQLRVISGPVTGPRSALSISQDIATPQAVGVVGIE